MAKEKKRKAESAQTSDEEAEALEVPENGPAEDSEEVPKKKSVVAAVLPAAMSQAIRVAIILCVGLLVIGLGIGIGVVLLSPGPDDKTEPVRTPEEIARDKEEQIKEAEKTATWRNAHCKLLPAYYQGPEADVPMTELVGLPADADEEQVQDRCAQILPAVHHLGGWPTAKPQQDNFLVCTGFRFELTGNFAFSVRVTPESLAANTVLYGRPGNEIHSQRISTDTAVGIGNYTPVVVQADDRCVVIGVERVGRRRAIPGRILRDGEAG